MVTVGVEWAERSESADAHADTRSSRHGPPDAAERNYGNADRDTPVALTNAAQRVVEHHRYRAIVARVTGAGRDSGPSGPDTPLDAAVPASGDSRESTWAEAAPRLRVAWENIKIKYEYAERSERTPQPDDGSWRGAGDRKLDVVQNAEIDWGYQRIREGGERSIIPGLRAVAAEDPTRSLAGFDRRFKGPDRLKEKVADLLEPPSKLTASDALYAVSDVVRCTYTYPEAGYTQGVLADVDRLKARGFELDKLKNTWTSDQYKGINAQWVDLESGVRFEVQFHTQASFDAKELSHQAYERIRGITDPSPETDREAAELEAFQSKVNAEVPIPPDVSTIEDFRREKRDG